jgi:hypothetical protein
MSMSDKLRKLKSQTGAVAGSSKAKIGPMDDVILASMASAVVSMGALSSAKTGSDWALKTAEILEGIKVQVRIPPGLLVEMDGMELTAELVNLADRISPAVVMKLSSEAAYAQLIAPAKPARAPAHTFIGVEVGSTYTRKQVAMAIIREMMKLQGWKFVSAVERWRSPVWLFPPVMVTWETLSGMVGEEIDYRSGALLEVLPEQTVGEGQSEFCLPGELE